MKNFKNLTALINKDYKHFSYGDRNVYRAYKSAMERKCDTLVFDSIIWEAEINETIQTLKDYKVKTFYYCINASGHVGLIAALADAGYKLVGSVKVPEICRSYEEQTYETGAMFTLTKKA